MTDLRVILLLSSTVLLVRGCYFRRRRRRVRVLERNESSESSEIERRWIDPVGELRAVVRGETVPSAGFRCFLSLLLLFEKRVSLVRKMVS